MATATLEAIRDRGYGLLEALTPTTLPRDKFRRYRNEGGADFRGWAEDNIPGALRRVQIREAGDETPPDVSDTVTERIRTTLEILIAYPQNARYGAANAMDRDDVMQQDWKSINLLVGIYGASNFSGSNDCIPLGCERNVERGTNIDFLVIRMRLEFVRAITP